MKASRNCCQNSKQNLKIRKKKVHVNSVNIQYVYEPKQLVMKFWMSSFYHFLVNRGHKVKERLKERQKKFKREASCSIDPHLSESPKVYWNKFYKNKEKVDLNQWVYYIITCTSSCNVIPYFGPYIHVYFELDSINPVSFGIGSTGNFDFFFFFAIPKWLSNH